VAANSCPCFFGERFPFTEGMAGVCNPARAGNLRDLLARGGAGDMKAQSRLGMFYEKGRNGDPAPSAKEAFFWYARAAEQGDAYGQFKMGQFYEAGTGVAAHCTRAMEWYEKAASKREKSADTYADSYAAMQAQARLGDIFEMGSCGPFDYAKALHWYKLAEQGQRDLSPLPDEAAALHLGDIYMKGGHGVEKNPAEAIKWYRAAVRAQMPSANARAEFQLAMIYAKGDVVEQDFQTACRWYAAAGRDPRYRSHNICDPIEPYLMPGELEKVIPMIGSGQLPE